MLSTRIPKLTEKSVDENLKDYFLVSLSIWGSVLRGREYGKTILAFYYDGSCKLIYVLHIMISKFFQIEIF